MRLPHEGFQCEVVAGELRLTPVGGMEHGLIAASLGAKMRAFAATHRLGTVCGSNLGCWMRSGNLCCPDLGFIAAVRVPRTPEARQRFFSGAPDLVAEILAPALM